MAKYKFKFESEIPRELHDNFQDIFSYLKKKYNIKFSRKSHIDNLLKKSKGKFFKVVHHIMSILLNFDVKRLPQTYITNITIKYNQKFLDKSILELYKEFNVLTDIDIMIEKNMIKPNKIDLLKKFCSYSLIELYQIYTESKRFKKEANLITLNDGKEIGILFEFVSKNLIAYYQNSKPHLINKNKIQTK